jgi:hypothetical protein
MSILLHRIGIWYGRRHVAGGVDLPSPVLQDQSTVIVACRVLEGAKFPFRGRFPACVPPLLENRNLRDDGDGIVAAEILNLAGKTFQVWPWRREFLLLCWSRPSGMVRW